MNTEQKKNVDKLQQLTGAMVIIMTATEGSNHLKPSSSSPGKNQHTITVYILHNYYTVHTRMSLQPNAYLIDALCRNQYSFFQSRSLSVFICFCLHFTQHTTTLLQANNRYTGFCHYFTFVDMIFCLPLIPYAITQTPIFLFYKHKVWHWFIGVLQ